MTPDKILQYCLNNLEGTVLVNSWGEKGIFYNPNNTLSFLNKWFQFFKFLLCRI